MFKYNFYFTNIWIWENRLLLFFNNFSSDADFELAFVSDSPAANTIENKANQQASVSYWPATDTNIDIFEHEASQL